MKELEKKGQTMTTLQFTPHRLAMAAMAAADKSELRRQFHYVWVARTPAEDAVTFAATNGHIVSVTRSTDRDHKKRIVMPPAFRPFGIRIDALLRKRLSNKRVTIAAIEIPDDEVEHQLGSKLATITTVEMGKPAQEAQVPFTRYEHEPDWRHVLNKAFEHRAKHTAAVTEAVYLGRPVFDYLAGLAKIKSTGIALLPCARAEKEQPFLVFAANDINFIGAVMPLRITGAVPYRPIKAVPADFNWIGKGKEYA